MNKYKIIYEILKKKVGSDPARIIVYNVYCDDLKKEIKRMKEWDTYTLIFNIFKDKWVTKPKYLYHIKAQKTISKKRDFLMKCLFELFEYENRSEYNLNEIDTHLNRKQIRLFKWDINKTS